MIILANSDISRRYHTCKCLIKFRYKWLVTIFILAGSIPSLQENHGSRSLWVGVCLLFKINRNLDDDRLNSSSMEDIYFLNSLLFAENINNTTIGFQLFKNLQFIRLSPQNNSWWVRDSLLQNRLCDYFSY